MKKRERRQLQLLCNRFQRNIMRSISQALLLSVFFFAGGFFWIYLNLKQWSQELIPLEEVQLLFNQSVFILACLTPLLLVICWMISWRVTYRAVGALERVTLELQQRIESGERSPIKVRKRDGIQSLVKKINHLLKAQK